MRNSSDQIFRLCDKQLESTIALNNWIRFNKISKGINSSDSMQSKSSKHQTSFTAIEHSRLYSKCATLGRKLARHMTYGGS